MKRRRFLQYSAVAAGAAFLPISVHAESKTKYANDIVTLGRTGIRASRLAMGTGTHGVNRRSNQTRKLGIEGVADLLYGAYEQGITFWDSADQYGTHPHLKKALKRVPREKVVILTKTHATTAEEMRADIDRFRQEIGTDYLDIVLLHFMTDPDWPTKKQAGMEVLAEMREQGIVRAHGVSCHTLGALEAAANSDWVQVDLARINPFGARMDDTVEKVVPILKRMHDQGKSVIGMKIFGAGQLRDKADECLKYVLAQDYVDAFTIGQENQDEMKDLIQRIPKMSL